MYSKKNIFPSFFDGILNKNVVTTLGFGIPLVIGASVDLKSGIVVCILMFAVNLVVCPLLSLAGGISKGIKLPIASIMAIVMIYLVANRLVLFTKEISGLGFYITLVAINSILIENIDAPLESHAITRLAQVFSQTLGFSLIMMLMSFTRELLSKGTIWGMPILKDWLTLRVSSAQAVFMGFLLLGLLIAGLRLLKVLIIRLCRFSKVGAGKGIESGWKI